MNKRLLLSLFAILLLATIVGCGGAPSPTPTPIFVLPTQPLIVVQPTDADLTPAPAITPPPDARGTPAPTVSAPVAPAQTSTLAAGAIKIKIFLVAIDDNGKSGKKIGCNDSIIGVDRTIPVTQGVLTAALNELFSLHERNYGQSGLYNALYQATLKLEAAAVINGRAIINLTGKLTRGGVCDDPRIKAQIEETALQFVTVRTVAVTINGVPIDKALSEK